MRYVTANQSALFQNSVPKVKLVYNIGSLTPSHPSQGTSCSCIEDILADLMVTVFFTHCDGPS